MIDATKQDIQNVTEMAKNKIIERLVTKYEVQSACDSSRDKVIGTLNDLHQENVLLVRQSIAQRDQMWRKTLALEGQIVSLQQEVRSLHQLIARLYEALSR